MGKETIKIFEIILNNSNEIIKEMRREFYKLLDLEGKNLSIYRTEDAKIKERIEESIKTFSFNLQETNLSRQIQEIIKEEIQNDVEKVEKQREVNNVDKPNKTSQEIIQKPTQEQLINACKAKYNELQRRSSYLKQVIMVRGRRYLLNSQN